MCMPGVRYEMEQILLNNYGHKFPEDRLVVGDKVPISTLMDDHGPCTAIRSSD